MRRVIIEAQEVTVNIGDVSKDKLYFFRTKFGDIYKLHHIDGGWAFLLMGDSQCWSCGSHSTMRKAIEIEKDEEIFEFDNLVEALGWMKCE